MTLPPKAQRYSEEFGQDYGDDYFSYYRGLVAGNTAVEKDLLRLLRSLEQTWDIFTEICERHEDTPGWEIFEGQIHKTVGSPGELIGFLPGLGEEPE